MSDTQRKIIILRGPWWGVLSFCICTADRCELASYCVKLAQRQHIIWPSNVPNWYRYFPAARQSMLAARTDQCRVNLRVFDLGEGGSNGKGKKYVQCVPQAIIFNFCFISCPVSPLDHSGVVKSSMTHITHARIIISIWIFVAPYKLNISISVPETDQSKDGHGEGSSFSLMVFVNISTYAEKLFEIAPYDAICADINFLLGSHRHLQDAPLDATRITIPLQTTVASHKIRRLHLYPNCFSNSSF